MAQHRREFQFHAYFDDEVNKGVSFTVPNEQTGTMLVAQLTARAWRGTSMSVAGRHVIGVKPFSVTLAEAMEVETASEIVLPRAEGVTDAEIAQRLTPAVQGSSVYVVTARFIDPAGATLHRYLYGSVEDALEASKLIAGRGSAPIDDPVPGTDRYRHRAVSSLVVEMQTRRTFAFGVAPTWRPDLGLEQ